MMTWTVAMALAVLYATTCAMLLSFFIINEIDSLDRQDDEGTL